MCNLGRGVGEVVASYGPVMVYAAGPTAKRGLEFGHSVGLGHLVSRANCLSNENSEPCGLGNDAMFPKHRSENLAGTVLPLCSFGKTVGGVAASRYANSTCDDDRLAKGGLKFGKTVGLGKTVADPFEGVAHTRPTP
jgi:hypothetical protein